MAHSFTRSHVHSPTSLPHSHLHSTNSIKHPVPDSHSFTPSLTHSLTDSLGRRRGWSTGKNLICRQELEKLATTATSERHPYCQAIHSRPKEQRTNACAAFRRAPLLPMHSLTNRESKSCLFAIATSERRAYCQWIQSLTRNAKSCPFEAPSRPRRAAVHIPETGP